MIRDQDLQELIGFSGDGVVSLYLNTDLSHESKEKCRLVLREQLGRIDDEVSPQDLDRIERFFGFEYDWQDRGVALFSCQQQDFWRAYALPVPVNDGAFAGDRPYVKPLADLASKFGSYGVVVVDREGVRMFHIRGGRVLETSESSGREVKRHKQGGWSQARYQRWVDGQAQQNLRQAVEATAQFFKTENCERLILGGTDVNLAQFQELLPKWLASHIVGTFSVGRGTGIDDILERSWDIMQQVGHQEEEALVAETITAARKGGPGVTGLADTLYRLHEGRVRVMVIAEGYTAAGYQCSSCGYVAAQDMPRCLFCGGEQIEAVEDAVDLAVHKAVETGAKVEVVSGQQALEDAGGIGAILRY